MKPISKLHFITTNAASAEDACKGGIDWIQLRLKNVPYAEYYAIARDVKAICRSYDATFIINDNVALAVDIGADGVHIGKKDMSPDTARTLIGDRLIIGCTANTLEDVIELSGKPIDYIGLGPYRFTNTKQNLSPILGIEGYQKIFTQLKELQVTPPPLIGIGGITEHDIVKLMDTGLHGIAASGAISNAFDITATSKAFKIRSTIKRTTLFDFELT